MSKLPVGFSKPKISGNGKYNPPASKVLDRDCKPGDIVSWSTFGGAQFIGELKEWDSNVAIVNIGNVIKAVEC